MINNNNNKKASIYTQVHLNTNKKKWRFQTFFNFISEIYLVGSVTRTLNFAENFGVTYTNIYLNAIFLFLI